MDDDKDEDCWPTPEEIKIRCQEVQNSWSKHKKESRKVIKSNEEVIPIIKTSDLSLDNY